MDVLGGKSKPSGPMSGRITAALRRELSCSTQVAVLPCSYKSHRASILHVRCTAQASSPGPPNADATMAVHFLADLEPQGVAIAPRSFLIVLTYSCSIVLSSFEKIVAPRGSPLSLFHGRRLRIDPFKPMLYPRKPVEGDSFAVFFPLYSSHSHSLLLRRLDQRTGRTMEAF